METKTFEGWCIIELFGHQQIAGLVSEQAIGGASFFRVDVPEVNGQSAFTKFYGSAAIYAITPTTEDLAREAARNLSVRPVSVFTVHPPAKQLPQAGLTRDSLCKCGHELGIHNADGSGCTECNCDGFMAY